MKFKSRILVAPDEASFTALVVSFLDQVLVNNIVSQTFTINPVTGAYTLFILYK